MNEGLTLLNILLDVQHGFRHKRSCESQLIITVQEIVKRLAKGSQVDIILLDFAKAFDKVKIGASCCAADLSINAGTSSGPVALCGFWFFNSL
jgi:hypothetical protein